MTDANDDKPDLQVISDIPERVYASMAAIAGMELDVFSQLSHGSSTAPQIAEMLGVRTARLERLLYALVNADLLTVENGKFANTPTADRYLVKGKTSYLGGAYELWRELFEATMKTAESIRNDRPAAYHDFGSMSSEEMGTFFRGLHGGAKSAGRALATSLDFSRFGSLLDVGGGSGGVAIGSCEVVPSLRATVVDLPPVVEVTAGFVAEENMSDRIDTLGADLSSDVLSGRYNVAVLRYLLQTVSSVAAASIIKNLAQCIAPGGEVHILGWMLDDNRQAPKEAVNTDIVFLNIYEDGAAYTVGEHADWLRQAGFVDPTWSLAPRGCTPGTILVSARKP